MVRTYNGQEELCVAILLVIIPVVILREARILSTWQAINPNE